jgi:hypothetical protein
MFFELRQYHIRPGQRENWVKCMEEEIIPFQVKMGMVILGSFVGEEDESVYVWIRRFESEAERKRLYDAVYQSDYWKNEISPRVPTMIDPVALTRPPRRGSRAPRRWRASPRDRARRPTRGRGRARLLARGTPPRRARDRRPRRRGSRS